MALLNIKGSQDPATQLFEKIYGTDPTDYAGVFDTGYANLGHGNEKGQHNEVAANGIIALATPYINAYMKQNGKLPTEDEVRSFVGDNLNSQYASDFITGNVSPDKIMSKYVTPALQQQKLLETTGQSNDQITKGIAGLNDLNSQLYEAAKNKLPQDVEELYTPQQKGLAEDLAAQNQLGQMNSRYSLDALQAQKQKAITQGLGNILVARAQGGIDVGKTAQQLMANQRSLEQQNQQFGQTFGLQRKALNQSIDEQEYQRGLQQQQLGLAAQLGRQQAAGQRNNGLGGSLGGAASGAMIGGQFGGPWGALAGGLGGGLLGYFGTKS